MRTLRISKYYSVHDLMFDPDNNIKYFRWRDAKEILNPLMYGVRFTNAPREGYISIYFPFKEDGLYIRGYDDDPRRHQKP